MATPFRILFVLCFAAAALSIPARAAIQLTPGNWRNAETGTENGKPVPERVSTDCMTPAEAADPIKALSAVKDQAGNCGALLIGHQGNVATFTMRCGDPKRMLMEVRATYTFIDRKHYRGVLKTDVSIGGRRMTSDKTIDSVWLGACPKK